MTQPRFTLTVKSHFSAALRLPSHPGACNAVHGYSYQVMASAKTQQPHQGAQDLDLIQFHKDLESLCQDIDHQYLNDLPAFSHVAPTSESIAKWFYDRLEPTMPERAQLIRITLHIGQTYEVCYEP